MLEDVKPEARVPRVGWKPEENVWATARPEKPEAQVWALWSPVSQGKEWKLLFCLVPYRPSTRTSPPPLAYGNKQQLGTLTEDWHPYWKKVLRSLLKKGDRLSLFLFYWEKEVFSVFAEEILTISTSGSSNHYKKGSVVALCLSPHPTFPTSCFSHFPSSYSVVGGPRSRNRRQHCLWKQELCSYICTGDWEVLIPLYRGLVERDHLVLCFLLRQIYIAGPCTSGKSRLNRSLLRAF